MLQKLLAFSYTEEMLKVDRWLMGVEKRWIVLRADAVPLQKTSSDFSETFQTVKSSELLQGPFLPSCFMCQCLLKQPVPGVIGCIRVNWWYRSESLRSKYKFLVPLCKDAYSLDLTADLRICMFKNSQEDANSQLVIRTRAWKMRKNMANGDEFWGSSWMLKSVCLGSCSPL